MKIVPSFFVQIIVCFFFVHFFFLNFLILFLIRHCISLPIFLLFKFILEAALDFDYFFLLFKFIFEVTWDLVSYFLNFYLSILEIFFWFRFLFFLIFYSFFRKLRISVPVFLIFLKFILDITSDFASYNFFFTFFKIYSWDYFAFRFL